MASYGDRIIVLIDMDCFFCQVESRERPELQGKPVAVVQYNQWRNGGIIAVNYEARDFGVTRHMRGEEAKEKCPDIVLVSVPSQRGRADGSKYRSAGREVLEVLKKHCAVIERASVDEAYLDITELVEKRIASVTATESNLVGSLSNTFVVGYCDDESNDEEQRRDGIERWISEAHSGFGDPQSVRLAVAGAIVEEFRGEIYEISKFRCSAGISYNKILAKLACGLHKPNRQTILPSDAVPSLYSTLPVKKVRNLGGKFGNIVMESLGCNVMADLMRFSLQDLQKRFDDKTGSWLYNIARGIDNEPVTTRLVSKSIGSSKNFPGKQAITKLEVLQHWVGELAADVSDRLEQDLEENERRATTLTVSFSYYENRKAISQSRSCPLKSYKGEKIAEQSVNILTRATQKPIAHIGIAAAKFVKAKGSGNFVNFFKGNGLPSDDTTILDTPVGQETVKVSTENVPKAADFFSDFTERSNLHKFDNKKPEEASVKLKTNSEPSSARNCEENSSTTNAETSERPKVESFFAKQAQINHQEAKNGEPISPSTAILGSTQCKRALNRENLKSSFFMNFLKESKPDAAVESEVALSACLQEPSRIENSVEAPIKPQKEPVTIDQEKQEEKDTKEVDLLAQLREIFPDIDNIDRSVVQLLPIELQRVANSYLKSRVIQKAQTVKSATKTKSKSRKSQKNTSTPNKFQNFFIKTSPNAGADCALRRCDQCNQMIKIEKFSEHADFHVAQNLQRLINQVDTREENRSPAKESEIDFPKTHSTKRRLSEEIEEPNKKAKTISSFFCV